MGGTHSRPTRVGPHDDGVSGASKTSLGGAWSWRRRQHSSPTSVTSLPSPAEAADAPAESWYSALLRLLNGKPAIDEPMTAVSDFGAAGDSFERDFLASAARRSSETFERGEFLTDGGGSREESELPATLPTAVASRVASRAASRTQSPARRRRGPSKQITAPTRRQRANSTNSVFTIAPDGEGDGLSRSTTTKPQADEVLFSAACYLQDRMEAARQLLADGAAPPPIFYAPSGATPPAADEDPPTEDEIFDYLSPLYYNSDVSAQCVVGALVYIERLFVHAGVPPLKSNWRQVVLTALVLAAKVWDDTGSSNAEFADASGTAYAVGDVNAMEQRFLHLIEYNVAITRQLYTRIYFELRELCERREVQLPLRPLSVAELDTIERRADARSLFTNFGRPKSSLRLATEHPYL